MTESVYAGLAFYVVAALVVISALAVVLLPRIIHAALALVIFFITIAGIYVLLHAEFIAAAQVLIYAGAITVLVLFAIMLTQASQTPGANAFNNQAGVAAVVALGAFGALLPALVGFKAATGPPQSANLLACFGGDASAAANTFEAVPACLGRLMLTDYVIAFEVASLLILIAMIGAIVIARET